MGRVSKEKTVVFYQDAAGHEPFTEWIEGFRDERDRRRILQRVFRMESNNYGDFKSLRGSVFELRLHFGAGYRVYFAEDGNTIVVLLCGGDKSTQKKDIEKAKEYWKEYTRHA